MNKKILQLCVIMLLLLMTGCANKTQTEINNDCSSGVVLIRNMSYYELRLSNGDVYFFTTYDKEEGLEGWTHQRSEVVKNESYGTGFFVDGKGLIATNKHVVAATVSEKEAKDALREVMDYTLETIKDAYYSKRAEYDRARTNVAWAQENDEEDTDAAAKVEDLARELDELFKQYQALRNIDPAASRLIYHTEVGVSYNNSIVQKTSEIHACDIVASSNTHDLALIKLQTGLTPKDKHVFAIPEENPLTAYSFSDKLRKQMGNDKNAFIYMIGFNLGPTLALTDEGIKAQINMGNISQNSQQRMMYSIPALPGSSGAPVINAQEELVAVNFAGIDTTQSFNYGIPVKFLKELMDTCP